jgi:hypothetical protein
MAETNVMGIFEFPPNIFDKILDRFSQAVQDNKYQKLDYVFWRKLKTSKNKVRIVVKSDLNGKLFFDIYPDVYTINYSFFVDGVDGSFGKYLIDNVCNIFTNDYAIKCSEKFFEYKMRRAKKTTEKNNDISKTCDELDYTKVYDKTRWMTEFSCANTISDEEAQKILGELRTTPIAVVPDSHCSLETGKVASINSNAIFATTLASAPDTITLGSQIDAIKDKCAMIDNDYIDDRINKVLNEQNTFNNVDDKKGNKKMKAFNFDFGPCTTDNIRMSMYGLAVKNANGTWVSYNPESKEIIDVDIFNFDGGKFLYKMPVAIKDVKVGDIVIHNRKAMFVTEVAETGMTAIDPQAGEEKKILLTRSPFGFNYATKVVSLFNMTSDAPTPDAPFGNMLPFLMMSENSGEFDMNTMLMLSMMGGQSGMDFSKNPMMMYFLMKDSKNADDLLPLMFMGNLCK